MSKKLKPNGLFAGARVIEQKPNAKPKDDRPVHEVEDLEPYTKIDALIEALISARDTYHSRLTGKMGDIFKAEVELTKRRPRNFRGVDGRASASMEFRKRSTRSPLNEAQLKALEDLGVPYGTEVDSVGAFLINPKYDQDEELLAKIEAVKGLPDDFILRQEAKERKVVTDETIEVAAQSPAKFAALMDVIGVLAIKAKIDNLDVRAAMDEVRDIIAPKDQKERDRKALKESFEKSLA